MRDWCSECQFANYGGSQEPCYNCITAYNKKPSEFTPATDGVRGVGKWIWHDNYGWDDSIECSCCAEEFCVYDGEFPGIDSFKFCPNCGARMGGVQDALS